MIVRSTALQAWIREKGTKEKIKDSFRSLPDDLRTELLKEAMHDDRVLRVKEALANCHKRTQETVMLEFYCGLDEILGSVPMPKKGWNDGNLPSANIIHTSSLFHVRNKSPRKFYREQTLFSRSTTVIVYTGEELFQDDYDVFLCLIKISSDAFNVCHSVSPKQIIRMLGWADNGQSYERLEKILRRLRQGSIYVANNPHKAQSPNVMQMGVSQDKTKGDQGGFTVLNLIAYIDYCRGYEIRFGLDPRIVRLYGNNEYGLIDIQRRIALGQNDLSKMLQCLISGAGVVQYHNVDKLFMLSGMQCARKEFTRLLARALEKLKKTGIIKAYDLPKAKWGRFASQKLTVYRS